MPLVDLQGHVEKKPIVVVRLPEAELNVLLESHRISNFTTAFPHHAIQDLKAPTVCLVMGTINGDAWAFLGIIRSKGAVTTLQSRISIRFCDAIQPESPYDLINLLEKSVHRHNLQRHFAENTHITVLTPKLSSYLIERLATLKRNQATINRLAEVLSRPKTFTNNRSLQADAFQMALETFGLSFDNPADLLQLFAGRETVLTSIPIIEDNVIEHDARLVPGYQLLSSELTGRAVFSRGRERLEVITANRRPLEQAFGVDLIYFNVTKRNIVLVQYKMMERQKGDSPDWVFVPDKQLARELERMRKFTFSVKAGEYEYRLNTSMFYLKFVKRDGAVSQSGIILPIDHYDLFIKSDNARGPRGGSRISYEALNGRYMRERAFLSLIRDGYIGAYAEATDSIMTLVNAILKRGHAVVAAIHSATDL
jgi:hypothetical protein